MGSAGKEMEEECRQDGKDTKVNVSYQFLKFFLEDHEELARSTISFFLVQLRS